MSPLKAIRKKCLDCSSDQPSEVKYCAFKECPLYPFRMGKNPNRKGIGNPFSNLGKENDRKDI